MAKVRINIDPTDKILLKRKLNRNGKAQKFFTSEVRRVADPYVPYRQGGLKNIQVQVYDDKIHYKAPYAKKQYYENKGYGEVRRVADPYVPYRQGGLKNIQVQVYDDKIHYKAPYAKKQYYENKGYGNQGTSRGGLRGKQWIPRMWSDKGRDVVKSVANYVGGKRR